MKVIIVATTINRAFYVAETALMQAEKSLIDKMMGPVDSTGVRQRAQGMFQEMET